MLKKIGTFLLAGVACLAVAGCAMGGDYDTVKKAQEEILDLSSGRIIVTSKYEGPAKSDVTVTEFTFLKNSSGSCQYCQTQFDRNNKAVYCEFSDGEKAEQWLIGNGWSAADPRTCTDQDPHRYLKLLSSCFEKKAVKKIDVTEEGENKRYILSLDAKRLNETTYKEDAVEIIEETVDLVLNQQGEMICYEDRTQLLDKETGEECGYSLNMKLSDQNSVPEIKRPELREYAAKTDSEAEQAE